MSTGTSSLQAEVWRCIARLTLYCSKEAGRGGGASSYLTRRPQLPTELLLISGCVGQASTGIPGEDDFPRSRRLGGPLGDWRLAPGPAPVWVCEPARVSIDKGGASRDALTDESLLPTHCRVLHGGEQSRLARAARMVEARARCLQVDGEDRNLRGFVEAKEAKSCRHWRETPQRLGAELRRSRPRHDDAVCILSTNVSTRSPHTRPRNGRMKRGAVAFSSLPARLIRSVSC
ncbi:hypothetical protein GGR56DRAFT_604100 [Xylariaceae sp. FL0804]|nr:hypothetical protein GGR56DRAFT_604100 [Xylariaceae sp. FL0804]